VRDIRTNDTLFPIVLLNQDNQKWKQKGSALIAIRSMLMLQAILLGVYGLNWRVESFPIVRTLRLIESKMG
jgi:hypothetical protein